MAKNEVWQSICKCLQSMESDLESWVKFRFYPKTQIVELHHSRFGDKPIWSCRLRGSTLRTSDYHAEGNLLVPRGGATIDLVDPNADVEQFLRQQLNSVDKIWSR